MEVTNHDLHILLTEIKGQVNVVSNKVDSSIAWQLKHEKDDKEMYEKLHSRISDMKIVSTGMSIVTLVIGIFTGLKIK